MSTTSWSNSAQTVTNSFAGAAAGIDYSYIPPTTAKQAVNVFEMAGLDTSYLNQLNQYMSLGQSNASFEKLLNQPCNNYTREQAISVGDIFSSYLFSDTGSSEALTAQQACQKELCAIEDALCAIKLLPDKIKIAVDTQAAMNNLDNAIGQVGSMPGIKSTLSTASAYVPVTITDFNEDPDKYPDLLELSKRFNKAGMSYFFEDNFDWYAEEMSCYKVSCTYKTNLEEFIKSQASKMEDNDSVATMAETLITTVIKTGFQSIEAPLNSICNVANTFFSAIGLSQIAAAPQAVLTIVQKLEEICTEGLTDQQLNDRIVKIQESVDNQQAEVQKAKNVVVVKDGTVQEQCEDLRLQAKDEYERRKAIADRAAQDAFKNMQVPDQSPDMITWSMDMMQAITQFISQISNIVIIIVLGIITKIIQTISDLLAAAGLDFLETFVTNLKTLVGFIISLPTSLMTLAKAILNKKQKTLYVIRHPLPPDPLKRKQPAYPTLDDIEIDGTKYVPYVTNAKKYTELPQSSSQSVVNTWFT